MPSISQAESWHLTSITYTTLEAIYCLCPTTKNYFLQLKILTSLTSCFSCMLFSGLPMHWYHSLILAWARKTHNCFQVSIPRLSAQPANQVSPLTYLFIFMYNRAWGMVFWLLTRHDTSVDKIITQAILAAQFYIWVIPSLGEDVCMPSSASPPGIFHHPFSIN